MTQLYKTLNGSAKVTVYETKESDFLDWGISKLIYRELAGLVKQNYIFSMDHSTCREGNKLLLYIKDPVIKTATHVRFNVIKKTFYRRKDAARSFAAAINCRPQIMRDAVEIMLPILPPPPPA